ncbi:Drebrin-like protein [Symbiodinium microadriaticum]|uniref:Drebrin-like protein n=1 Tax=Symbiodinium microadriaticum TaxID=2951 RepID=A0A1Q9C7R5_SYMMI|nr:Drebrin-like protein [Symbiodinium microadriaticum]
MRPVKVPTMRRLAEVASGKELTVDYLCEVFRFSMLCRVEFGAQRLLPVFSTDHMEYSLQASEISRPVGFKRRKEPRETEGVLPPPVPTLEPPTAHAVHGPSDVTLQEAMQEVASEEGFFNWVLIDPSRLCLYKAGQGGFDELQVANLVGRYCAVAFRKEEHLASERVLFGVLRMRTVHGLTKHVLVHWVGPGVSVMRRGLDSARHGQVANLVGRYCAVAFRKEVHCAADLRRLTVVDSTSGGSGQAASRISVEEYNIVQNLALGRRLERDFTMPQEHYKAMAEESRHRDSRLQRLRPKQQAPPLLPRHLEAATPRAEPIAPTQMLEACLTLQSPPSSSSSSCSPHAYPVLIILITIATHLHGHHDSHYHCLFVIIAIVIVVLFILVLIAIFTLIRFIIKGAAFQKRRWRATALYHNIDLPLRRKKMIAVTIITTTTIIIFLYFCT